MALLSMLPSLATHLISTSCAPQGQAPNASPLPPPPPPPPGPPPPPPAIGAAPPNTMVDTSCVSKCACRHKTAAMHSSAYASSCLRLCAVSPLYCKPVAACQ